MESLFFTWMHFLHTFYVVFLRGQQYPMASIRDEGKIKTMRIKHCYETLARCFCLPRREPTAYHLSVKMGDLEIPVGRCKYIHTYEPQPEAFSLKQLKWSWKWQTFFMMWFSAIACLCQALPKTISVPICVGLWTWRSIGRKERALGPHSGTWFYCLVGHTHPSASNWTTAL